MRIAGVGGALPRLSERSFCARTLEAAAQAEGPVGFGEADWPARAPDDRCKTRDCRGHAWADHSTVHDEAVEYGGVQVVLPWTSIYNGVIASAEWAADALPPHAVVELPCSTVFGWPTQPFFPGRRPPPAFDGWIPQQRCVGGRKTWTRVKSDGVLVGDSAAGAAYSPWGPTHAFALPVLMDKTDRWHGHAVAHARGNGVNGCRAGAFAGLVRTLASQLAAHVGRCRASRGMAFFKRRGPLEIDDVLRIVADFAFGEVTPAAEGVGTAFGPETGSTANERPGVWDYYSWRGEYDSSGGWTPRELRLHAAYKEDVTYSDAVTPPVRVVWRAEPRVLPPGDYVLRYSDGFAAEVAWAEGPPHNGAAWARLLNVPPLAPAAIVPRV